jgi:hypothetical protein
MVAHKDAWLIFFLKREIIIAADQKSSSPLRDAAV